MEWAPREETRLVRLVVKLADVVEGIDLSHCVEGDIIELCERDARLLIAGGWADEVSDEEGVACVPELAPDVAADESSNDPKSTVSRQQANARRS